MSKGVWSIGMILAWVQEVGSLILGRPLFFVLFFSLNLGLSFVSFFVVCNSEMDWQNIVFITQKFNRFSTPKKKKERERERESLKAESTKLAKIS